jgi:hypothetical protein
VANVCAENGIARQIVPETQKILQDVTFAVMFKGMGQTAVAYTGV